MEGQDDNDDTRDSVFAKVGADEDVLVLLDEE